MREYEGWRFIGADESGAVLEEINLDALFDKVPVSDDGGNFLFFERRYNGKKQRQITVSLGELKRDYEELQAQIDYAEESRPRLRLTGVENHGRAMHFEAGDFRAYTRWFVSNHHLIKRKERLDLILRHMNSKVA